MRRAKGCPLTVTDPAAIRAALRLRRGGRATPWTWQLSHSWFTLRVEHPDLAGNLHLVGGACERVAFDRHIPDCDVRIEESGPGPLFRVSDGDRLLILCGVVRIEYNVMPVFGLR